MGCGASTPGRGAPPAGGAPPRAIDDVNGAPQPKPEENVDAPRAIDYVNGAPQPRPEEDVEAPRAVDYVARQPKPEEDVDAPRAIDYVNGAPQPKPEEDVDAPRAIDYVSEAEIFHWLRPPAGGGKVRVKLLKSRWIIARADAIEQAAGDEERAALAVPCRQVLEQTEPDAYYTAEEFDALPRSKYPVGGENSHALALISASYCWETPEHPDPLGRTLVKLAKALRKLCAYRSTLGASGLDEYGVFFDWTALPQKVEGKKRDEADQAAFSDALSCMQLWYAHMLTTVFLLTAPQEGATSLPYDARGWPCFERLVSMILTPNSVNAWPMIVDVGAVVDADKTIVASGCCKRLAPQSVERFGELMRSKKFTNGADCELVIGLYQATLHSVLGSAPALEMRDNGHWGDEEMRSLVEVLPLCAEATMLDISFSFDEVLTAEGVAVLSGFVDAGKLPPKLKVIKWLAKGAHRADRPCTQELRAACDRRGVEATFY